MGEQGFSRRRLLRDAGVVAAGLAAASVPDAAARPPARARRRARPAVAVLGGGVAGLTAAHELAERGFDVTVYERKALGGKARSIPVAGTARDGRRDLPGEHGFRFFPGFYHHVPDTMRRIPFAGNASGVWDNLTAASGVSFARNGGRADLKLDQSANALTPEALRETLTAGFQEITTLPPHELAYWVSRVLVFFTSCDERRYGQWEKVSWWDYTAAARMSREYQRMLAIGLTRNLVAARAEVASTRTIGNMAEAFIMNIMGRGNDGAPDRVLNAPTNEAWIAPWVVHLQSLGVRFRVGQTVEALAVQGGRIAGVRARDGRGRRRRIEADWYVLAMPMERARRLWSPAVRAADPSLAGLDDLHVDWMNGLQLYLRTRVDILRGHVSYVDSPWALTSLTQAQFWAHRDFARDYGDGTVQDCLSVDISNWEEPGILYGRPARACGRDEIAREVWAQIKAHLEDTGRTYLPDGILHSYHLDPAIGFRRRGPRHDDEPLLVNTIGSWEKRPGPATKIANLFLAGDYVRTNIDLATMEGANESARAAVHALLDASGSSQAPPSMYQLYRPPEFEAFKRADAAAYAQGRPNAFDVPYPG